MSLTINFTGTVNDTGNLILINDPVHPFMHHNLSIKKKREVFIFGNTYAYDDISVIGQICSQ